MALRMARPIRFKSSSSVRFRERIPCDVLAKAKGMSLALPVADDLAHVTVGPNGNYSADPNADRFGVWQPPKAGGPSLDWSGLLAGWRREAPSHAFTFEPSF